MRAIPSEYLSSLQREPVFLARIAVLEPRRPQLRWRQMTGILVSLLLIGVAWLFPQVAYANGAPVEVFLSYLPNISNWGPQDATGHAVVTIGEGEVTLQVEGLPRLEREHYEVWLESRSDRQLYSVGKFNAKADGTGHLAVLLDTLPYQEYRLLLITVEPDPDPNPEPDARRSIAGFLPNTVLTQTTEGSAPGLETGQLPSASSALQSGPRPRYLPVTGGNAQSVWAALALLGVILVAGRACARKGNQP